MLDKTTPTHFESLYPVDSRSAELEKIVTFIKEGNSCQIVSLPGVGRANLLGFLAYNKAIKEKHLRETLKWFHFVVVNFSEVRKKSLFDVTKFLFLALVDSLQERGLTQEYEKASTIFKESLNFNDEVVLFGGLKKTIDLLAIEKELTVVFLFDRFESYIPQLSEDFFTNLRILRNRAKYRFSVVLTLNRPLEDSIDPAVFADFHEFLAGHTIYLPLVDEQGIMFRIAYIQKVTGKTLDKKLLDKVLELTAKHGKLTRISVEILTNGDHADVTAETVENFLLSQKTIRGVLYEIWNALTPAEQTHLEKALFGKDTYDEHTQYLEHVGLIKNEKIIIPLFAAFVESQKQNTSTQKEEHISFDAMTNDITKGKLVLTDKLTTAEYRLLQYLLENSDKILAREEVITAVWQDKSTAGVTDQALDQLIFRIRKKIEDDPNNPQHLQTVKGRGFRFLP